MWNLKKKVLGDFSGFLGENSCQRSVMVGLSGTLIKESIGGLEEDRD